MQLTELEALLGITIKAEQTAMYEVRLAAAIDQAIVYCNNSFEVDGVLAIPAGAKMGIALMVKDMGENKNVASQSLGDMSKSFFNGGTNAAAKGYLKPYRKVRFK